MFGRGIMIRWDGSTEYLPVDLRNVSQCNLDFTLERWGRRSSLVKYNVTTAVQIVGKKYILEISYVREANDSKLARVVRWGHSRIEIAPGKDSGTATWCDSFDTSHNGVSPWEALPGGLVQAPTHQKVTQIERQQAMFRNALLALEPRCALTGERTAASLEAAHVVPAMRGGREVLENGMLLRADLHRLWDAGSFQVLEDGRVSGIQDVSDAYRQVLTGARILPGVMARISEALRFRQGGGQS